MSFRPVVIKLDLYLHMLIYVHLHAEPVLKVFRKDLYFVPNYMYRQVHEGVQARPHTLFFFLCLEL